MPTAPCRQQQGGCSSSGSMPAARQAPRALPRHSGKEQEQSSLLPRPPVPPAQPSEPRRLPLFGIRGRRERGSAVICLSPAAGCHGTSARRRRGSPGLTGSSKAQPPAARAPRGWAREARAAPRDAGGARGEPRGEAASSQQQARPTAPFPAPSIPAHTGPPGTQAVTGINNPFALRSTALAGQLCAGFFVVLVMLPGRMGHTCQAQCTCNSRPASLAAAPEVSTAVPESCLR